MTFRRNNAKRWQFGTRELFKLVLVLAIILGAGVALYPVFDDHPVTMTRLKQVNIGMTESEVARILGEPSAMEPGDWRYFSWDWCFVVVKFDDSRRVTLVEHDH